MKHTEHGEAEAVLRLSVLDTGLIQALSRHKLVVVEQRDNGYTLTLYDMTNGHERLTDDGSRTDYGTGRLGGY